MWIFDTLNQRWSQVATGFSGRSYHAMLRLDTTIFIHGGVAASQPQLLTYDISLDTMSQPSVSGTQPTARTEHSMCALANRIYLFGGITIADGAFDGAVYELDACVGCPSNTWRTISVFGERPLARRGHTADVIGHIMYVFGGVDISGQYQDSVYALDLRSFRWSRPHSIGAPPAPRWGHASILLNEAIHIIAGIESPPSAPQFFSNSIFTLSRRCQGTVRLTSSDGSISMLNSQVGATACSWELFPSGAHREVEVYFSFFSLQPGDELKVFDGSELLTRLTGSSLPARLTSSHGGLVLNFTSDSGTGDGYGFDASYRALCSAGSAYARSVSTCELCPNGTFARSPGSTCTSCDDRHYADAEGSIECNACPDYSRAAGLGASSILECLCLPGFYRRNNNAPCEACPTGAICRGGTMGPWPSAEGWCRDGADYLRCCGEACPLGIDACPSRDGSTAELGQDKCPSFSFASLSLVAFIVVLVVVVVVGLCCWCLGFASGLRKGNRLAIKEMMNKFDLGANQQVMDVEVAAMVNSMMAAADIGVSGLTTTVDYGGDSEVYAGGGISDIRILPASASRPTSGGSSYAGSNNGRISRSRTVPI
mmetsp:Transcript_31883/g.97396  ORF Transcript_31883/g.97396 Transcript_31883/m.97396 type:complete len:598 (+) Transcript_31883:113-1906(+)